MSSNTVHPDSASTQEPTWYLQMYEQDSNGDTQLHMCMMHLRDTYSFAIRLIAATRPPTLLNMVNNDGLTALHFAAVRNDYLIIRLLLTAGADPLLKDQDGHTPLHFACMAGCTTSVKALITPFSVSEVGVLKLKQLRILDLTKAIAAKNKKGEVPLHLASKRGHVEVAKMLLNVP